MQSASLRYLTLAVVLSLGALAFVAAPPGDSHAARGPIDDALFAVDGWRAGPASIELINDTQFVTRDYASGDTTATLVIKSGTAAKAVYRAGPEVALAGSGFSVSAVRPETTGLPGGGALIGVRGDDAYLTFYAYGERRGLLGNGWRPWTAAVVDGLLGRDNDYYELLLFSPYAEGNQARATAAHELARELFARSAEWYASPAT
jgi:hypothetical protein